MRERLLTAREVAGILGVSSETVLRWVRRGQLDAIRLPSGALRFEEQALQDWLAARATPTTGVATSPGRRRPRREPSIVGLATSPDDDRSTNA
jgi:excisionase family DNA binding protein